MNTRLRIAGTIALAALCAAGWQPVPAAAEPARRGAGRGAEERRQAPAEDDTVEQAERAAERAGVSSRTVRSLLELAERGGFPPSHTVRVLSLAAQLALEGLPVECFEAKVCEGVSKRVDPDRAVQVAERRALMLNRAKAIVNAALLEGLEHGVRDEVLPDVAQALEGGMTEGEVRDILEEALQEGGGGRDIRRKLFP